LADGSWPSKPGIHCNPRTPSKHNWKLLAGELFSCSFLALLPLKLCCFVSPDDEVFPSGQAVPLVLKHLFLSYSLIARQGEKCNLNWQGNMSLIFSFSLVAPEREVVIVIIVLHCTLVLVKIRSSRLDKWMRLLLRIKNKKWFFSGTVFASMTEMQGKENIWKILFTQGSQLVDKFE